MNEEVEQEQSLSVTVFPSPIRAAIDGGSSSAE